VKRRKVLREEEENWKDEKRKVNKRKGRKK